MNTGTQLFHFYSETGILDQNDDDGVLFGETLPCFSPEGLSKVLEIHIAEIDTLRAKLPFGSLKELELFLLRGFTFNEYEALFDLGIKEKDFVLYPAFRSLWIHSESQRRKIIYKIEKQNFNDYLALLQKCLKQFNPPLFSFFFPAHPAC